MIIYTEKIKTLYRYVQKYILDNSDIVFGKSPDSDTLRVCLEIPEFNGEYWSAVLVSECDGEYTAEDSPALFPGTLLRHILDSDISSVKVYRDPYTGNAEHSMEIGEHITGVWDSVKFIPSLSDIMSRRDIFETDCINVFPVIPVEYMGLQTALCCITSENISREKISILLNKLLNWNFRTADAPKRGLLHNLELIQSALNTLNTAVPPVLKALREDELSTRVQRKLEENLKHASNYKQ
jgi:hypothetical protein